MSEPLTKKNSHRIEGLIRKIFHLLQNFRLLCLSRATSSSSRKRFRWKPLKLANSLSVCLFAINAHFHKNTFTRRKLQKIFNSNGLNPQNLLQQLETESLTYILVSPTTHHSYIGETGRSLFLRFKEEISIMNCRAQSTKNLKNPPAGFNTKLAYIGGKVGWHNWTAIPLLFCTNDKTKRLQFEKACCRWLNPSLNSTHRPAAWRPYSVPKLKKTFRPLMKFCQTKTHSPNPTLVQWSLIQTDTSNNTTTSLHPSLNSIFIEAANSKLSTFSISKTGTIGDLTDYKTLLYSFEQSRIYKHNSLPHNRPPSRPPFFFPLRRCYINIRKSSPLYLTVTLKHTPPPSCQTHRFTF